jgi:hypothetical protein
MDAHTLEIHIRCLLNVPKALLMQLSQISQLELKSMLQARELPCCFAAQELQVVIKAAVAILTHLPGSL